MEKIKSVKLNSCGGVLFLQGVFKRDCKRMEEIFQDRLMHDTVPIQESKIYDKIPVNFTSILLWPKYTNLLCWFCNRSFRNRSWFEPQSIEPISEGHVGKLLSCDEIKNSVNVKGVSIVTLGVFCTCNCVRAYIDLYTKDLSERLNKIAMLKFVYELYNGKCIPDIQPSPSPTCMVHYGGNITPIEYQKKIDQLDISYIHELEDNNFANICSIYLGKLNT
jgi:hypothetical protein